jgi:hypothetical protein
MPRVYRRRHTVSQVKKVQTRNRRDTLAHDRRNIFSQGANYFVDENVTDRHNAILDDHLGRIGGEKA